MKRASILGICFASRDTHQTVLNSAVQPALVNSLQRRLLLFVSAPGILVLLYGAAVWQLGGPLSGEWSAIALVGWALILGGAGATEVVALLGR